VTVTLRPATHTDLDQVVAVFLGCWRSYAAYLPAALVASMTDDAAVDLWRRVLADQDRVVVLAKRSCVVSGVVGYSLDGHAGWVQSLYVAPSEQGQGTGSALLRYAARDLSRSGAQEGFLWVFADNVPAVAFYQREGWRPDGVTRVEEQFGEPELRMTRPLEAAVLETAP